MTLPTPRDRVISRGADSLDDGELLALLLGTGSAEAGVLELARWIEQEVGGVRALSQMHPAELLRIPGLGSAKVGRILAALELGRRICSRPWERGEPFSSSRRVFEHCHLRLRDQKRERFHGLFLDARNRLVGEEEISCGSLVSSLVHPREVFRPAIRHAAAALICVHNHPSGDPAWSADDVAITQRLFDAGALIGIDLVDHVIIGDGRYLSFVDERIPPFETRGSALRRSLPSGVAGQIESN